MQTRILFAIGTWSLLGVALAIQSHSNFRKQARRVSPDEIVEQMQKGIQHGLEDLSMTNLMVLKGKDEHGKIVVTKMSPRFGLSRAATAGIEHNGVLRYTGVPIPIPGMASDGITIAFYGVSCKGNPLERGKMTIHDNFGAGIPGTMPNLRNEVLRFADKALYGLKKEDRYEGMISGFRTIARPISLSKPECLPCHANMKLGDTAAMIVYVIERR